MAETLAPAANRIRHPLVDGTAPEWASGWGQDEYGIFAEFSLPTRENDRVTQRMRWLPPDRFLMGSPNDEPGRDSDEGPQREVTLTQGFWLFDTPCTQALWRAVMGDDANPSKFVDAERPVEQVGWDETQGFMEELSRLAPGLKLQLPSEAQWEYACRAGTTTATYAGPIEIVGANNAPILHEIAWYGGNSGVEFDLEEGWDSSAWEEKQCNHEKAGTRKVGQKRPNAWGLFDMLGNVWEWCDDWWSEDYSGAGTVDPTGPTDGRSRVLRGGGWLNVAQSVRSAVRNYGLPGGRGDGIGFRCALVQVS